MAKIIDEEFDFRVPKRTYEQVSERQGSLDNLCGIYCVINALNHVANLSQKQRSELFKRIIKNLAAKGKIAKTLLHGTSEKRLHSIFKIAQKYLAKNHNLQVNISPFFEPNVRMDLAKYLSHIDILISQQDHIVIAEITGIYHHWTCISSFTPKTVQLLDSDGLSYLKIKNCRLSKRQIHNKHCLHPSRTWVVRLEG